MRMPSQRIPALVWASVAGVLGEVLLWALLAEALVVSTLPATDAESLAGRLFEVLAGRWPLLLLALLPPLGVAGWVGWQMHQRWLAEPRRLAEAAKTLVQTDARRLSTPVHTEVGRQLLDVLHRLVDQREALRADVADQVAAAAHRLEQERSRLAALMSELTQSVVVCNREGRIILYNQRARMQFRALSHAPGVAQGTELLGIGRSVYAVFDARLVQHALAHIQRRMARGAQHPQAQFVTHTRAGQLLRVQVAPVRAVAPDGGAHGASPKAPDELAGFVLMLDNITQAFEADAQRDRQVLQWLQTARTLAGRLKLGVDAATAEGAEAWRQSAAELDRVLADALNHYSQQAPVRWPLEDVLGADWLALVAQRLGGTPGLGVRLDEVDGALWLRLDSYAMLQVVQSLVQRLVAEFGIGHVRLRLQAQEGKGALDLVFAGQVMSTETVMTWELDPMVVDGESLPLSVRDVLNRHGAQLWFERDRPRHEAFFRLLLPLASGQAGEAPPPPPAWAQGRPEFYDFDLFQQSPQVAAAEDRPLAELVYTVFDTETTGLNPSGGDEIIQIGATRVVNLKVRRTEVFDQLVDPQRHIPAQTIPIHGITPEMVKGQPTLDQVLPAFHAFAQDSVLVAHNAAFDMKFLSLKQKRLGLVFDHPVLDTLLLASVVFPNQESNRLEALAERFGLTIQGRHTALGDALVTAEVFVRLVPLLADRGIHTMRQAREASQATYLAKLQY